MPNANTPFGARPLYNTNGTSYTGNSLLCAIPASDGAATFLGDFVKLGGSSDATTGVPTVVQAAATEALYGVIVSFEPLRTNLELNYRAASTLRYCYVCVDKGVMYEMQEDSVGNNIDANMVGLAVDIVVGAGNTVTGVSAMQIDSSDTATAAGQVRLMGLVRREDNAVGTNAKWLVVINESQLAVTTDF